MGKQFNLSKKELMLVSLFLGPFGLDRYLMGYKFWYVKLLTFGGFYVWALYDFIMISIGKMKFADGSNPS